MDLLPKLSKKQPKYTKMPSQGDQVSPKTPSLTTDGAQSRPKPSLRHLKTPKVSKSDPKIAPKGMPNLPKSSKKPYRNLERFRKRHFVRIFGILSKFCKAIPSTTLVKTVVFESFSVFEFFGQEGDFWLIFRRFGGPKVAQSGVNLIPNR